MAKILLVEDDGELACMIATCLAFEHYAVESVVGGNDAFARLRTFSYDMVILDWTLPGMSGLQICKQFRQHGGITPILMLTARHETVEKEAGLDSGADDYLTKPFDMKELLARIRALLRRASSNPAANVLTFNNITLEPTNFRVCRAGYDVPLVAKEFALLELFMRHPGRLFSVDTLIGHVWRADENTSPESVRQQIKNLRRKLEAVDASPVIQTVRGLGYKLESSGALHREPESPGPIC